MLRSGEKRIRCIFGALFLCAAAAFCQTSLSSGMDVNEITKRIISSTKYKLTPGDTYLLVATTAGVPSSFSLVLQDDYGLDVPYMGTINVKGMYFTDLRKLVMERMKKLMPMAEFLSFTLLSPARFDVEVYGGVEGPGTVTASPLNRVSDVITLARGIRKGASTRQIVLKRGDRAIPIDLVLYGLKNDEEKNPNVEPGDVVYVPPTSVTVTLSGQVRYPGTYELVPGDTAGSLIEMVGGLLPEALPGRLEILRFNTDGTTSSIVMQLKENPAAALQNGDRIRVPAMMENTATVLVMGAVFGAPFTADKPVPVSAPSAPVSIKVPYLPGLTLLAVLEQMGGPTPYAKADESFIIRAATGERVLVDANTLWATKNMASDVALEPGDTVNIPMIVNVLVVGEVRMPGRVPYSPVSTVSDYIAASGGINDITGDINSIYLVDKQGMRTKANLTDSVAPGTIILADKNWWFQTQMGLGNVLVITGFIGSVASVVITVLDIIY